jgi:hypothetical protein
MHRYCCSKYHPADQDRYLGEVPPIEKDIKTDGFCPPCHKKELEAIEEYGRTHLKSESISQSN